jgi:hypothetical protein
VFARLACEQSRIRIAGAPDDEVVCRATADRPLKRVAGIEREHTAQKGYDGSDLSIAFAVAGFGAGSS